VAVGVHIFKNAFVKHCVCDRIFRRG